MKSTTEAHMLAQFGPLMTYQALAGVLSRSVGGLRLGLRTEAPWAQQLRQARRRVGKRVYFHTATIAKFVDGENE